MAIVIFTGFEFSFGAGNAAAELSGTGGGGFTSDYPTVKRTGNHSIRSNPTTTDTGYGFITGLNTNGTPGTPTHANSYTQFWFRYATKPSSNSEEIFAVWTSANAYKLSCRINSDGTLALYDAATTLLGTSSTALSQDTWYKIEVQCGSSATVGAYALRINGVSEVSGTGNTNATSAAKWVFGKITDRNGNTLDMFYDDAVVDNSAFVTGDVEVKQMIPDRNGSTMSWTAGTGSSDYQEVDDPTDFETSTYVQSPTTGNPNIALFGLETTSSAGISGTIKAFKGIIQTRENTSVTSATLIRIRSNATNSDSTTRNGSTTATAVSRLLETDPNTSAAWTTSGLDAVEVGAVENNAVAVRCTFVRGMVLYTPPSASTVVQDVINGTGIVPFPR